MRVTFRQVARTSAAFVLVSALNPCAAGQGVGAGQNPRRTDRQMQEQQEMEQEAEFRLRMIDDLRLPAERPKRRPTLALVREDYVRLQIVNNELARSVSSGNTLDLKFIRNVAIEIKKRASRLRANLGLPEDSKQPAEPPGQPIDLGQALATLDELILRFVRNPIFRSPRLLDVEHSGTAQRELKEIVELSDQIRKLSERLNRVGRQSR